MPRLVRVVRVVRVLWRLVRHEFVLWACLLRWLARRRPHGVREGDTPVAYASAQTVIFGVMFFVSVVETLALAFFIPWPLVHLTLLVVDVWGLWFIVALHAACAVRPHVVGADGSLRLRYGALFDLRIPAGRIAAARVERRYPEGSMLRIDEDGTLDLIVSGQTTVAIELTEPVTLVRPLGRRAQARLVRCNADDPARLVAALTPHGAARET
jgi:hypothetical protein